MISQGTIPEAAFGEESVFDYLESNNGLWINIGCEPNQGYSLIHRAEQLMNIPYRESITFPVIFKDACLNTREIDYQFFARKSDFDSRECFDRLFNCSIFRNSNMSDSPHEYLTIHKYNELTHYICNTMRDNSFAFVMHAQS